MTPFVFPDIIVPLAAVASFSNYAKHKCFMSDDYYVMTLCQTR